jgi:hypothetical protein
MDEGKRMFIFAAKMSHEDGTQYVSALRKGLLYRLSP